MFIAKVQRDGEDLFVEIPSHEVEAMGLKEGDWVETDYWRPTEDEFADHFAKHPEELEPDS